MVYRLKHLFRFILFALFLFEFSNKLQTQEIPQRPWSVRFVVDYANVLSKKEKSLLENKLKKYSDQTSNQIVVVIIKSLNGAVLEDYSHKLAEGWGIGQKGKNNGILILTAIKERKIRIEIGYGLEDVVPDVIAKRIIENLIVPNFKEGEFALAYNLSIDFLIKAIAMKNAGTQDAYENIHDELDILSENKNAVFAGRMVLYTFMAVVFLGVLAFISGRKTAKERILGYIVLALMCSAIVFGEWLYWNSVHSNGFWFFQLMSPFFIMALFFPIVRKIVYKDNRFILLKTYTKNEISWKKLYHLYRNQDVLQIFNKYKSIVEKEQLTPKKIKRIDFLIKEIEKHLKTPEKFFKEKSNARLTKANDKIRSINIFKNKKYKKQDLDKLIKNLKEQIDYFNAKANSDLDEQDKTRMNDFVEKLNKIIQNPDEHLKLDYNYMQNELRLFFENDARWISYKKKYTSKSIDNTRLNFKKFNIKLKKLGKEKNNEFNQEVHDLYKKVEKLKQNPGSYLKKKPVLKTRSSSSSSWSSSISYSSSSSGSSSSSFGGGSFGGGGSSGSW